MTQFSHLKLGFSQSALNGIQIFQHFVSVIDSVISGLFKYHQYFHSDIVNNSYLMLRCICDKCIFSVFQVLVSFLAHLGRVGTDSNHFCLLTKLRSTSLYTWVAVSQDHILHKTSFENISQVMTSLMFVCHWVTDGEKNFWIIWKTNNSTTVCISSFSNFNLKPDVLSFWEDEIDNGREDEEDGAAKMRKSIIMMVIWFQQMQSQRPQLSTTWTWRKCQKRAYWSQAPGKASERGRGKCRWWLGWGPARNYSLW